MPQAKPTPGTGQSSEAETAQVLYIIRARIDTGRSRGARQLTRDIRALKRAEAEIVRLRAALDQPLVAQPLEVQPLPGWLLVPMTITSEMKQAGGHVNSEWLNDNAPIGETRYAMPMQGIWDAMLAANGIPPTKSEGVRHEQS
ncbi:hypothetical protein [Rhodoferax sp. WC2427]|uniref:hypothetical protein n=1 Tax=Rhodoferax sp. WC2427 TaxID=3234144 RepID=UPI003465B36F